jgi:uncharacterized membrane protein YdjX (TVP38/TMEM64 family)
MPDLPSTTEALLAWLRSFGDLSATSAVVIASLFFFASFLPFPRTFLLLGVGGLFGLQVFSIILPSTTAGGILAFLLARYLFSARIRRWLRGHRRLIAIADAVDEESWRIVALFRFASPVPNAIQNYIFGLTRIGLIPYALATLLFSIPQMVLYLYLGAVGRAVLVEDGTTALARGLMVIASLCLALILFLVGRRARMSLRRQELAWEIEQSYPRS